MHTCKNVCFTTDADTNNNKITESTFVIRRPDFFITSHTDKNDNKIMPSTCRLL